MTTLACAFQSLLESLELTPKQRQDASEQHAYMRTELQRRLDVKDNFLTGSYARHTAIRPLNDIDIFLVLQETAGQSRKVPHTSLLNVVQNALREIYRDKAPSCQAHSVHIEFSTKEIAYDIVPAFYDGEGYVIPDRNDPKKWIRTNPRRHEALSIEANERSGKMLKPLLKAIKHARHFHESRGESTGARSFHIEVLSWNIIESKPEDNMSGLERLLAGLSSQICNRCPDPAGLGPDIQPSQERCRKTKAWLDRMLALVRDARRLDERGHLADAHARMRELFGPQWPVTRA